MWRKKIELLENDHASLFLLPLTLSLITHFNVNLNRSNAAVGLTCIYIFNKRQVGDSKMSYFFFGLLFAHFSDSVVKQLNTTAQNSDLV